MLDRDWQNRQDIGKTGRENAKIGSKGGSLKAWVDLWRKDIGNCDISAVNKSAVRHAGASL